MTTPPRRIGSRKTQFTKEASSSGDSSGAETSSGHLRLLGEPVSTPNTIFIVVPGHEKVTAEQRHASESTSASWLCLPDLQSAGKISVFVYEHDLPQDVTPSWETINHHGVRLCHELQQLQADPVFESCPMVIISHSVGGFLLKRAICLAYSWQENIRASVAAAVLISIPHTKDENSEAWTQTLPRMQKSAKRLGRQATLHSSVAKSLSKDCREFEQAFNHVPIATVYEKGEIRTSRLTRASKVLVDRDLAKTNMPGEVLIGIDSEHHCSYRLAGHDDVWKPTASFLLRSVEKTRAVLLDRKSRAEEAPSFSADSSAGVSRIRRLSLLSADSSPSTSPVQDKRLHIRRRVDSHIQAEPTMRPSSPRSIRPEDLIRGGTTPNEDSELPSLIPAFATGRVDEPKFPYFVVPYARNKFFFGRVPTLSKMVHVLCCERNSTRDTSMISFGLTGQAGIGKTQVAVEFVYRHSDHFDAIFWVRAHDIARLHQSFREIAITLGLVEPLSTDSFDKSLTRSLVLRWLERPPKRPGAPGSDPIWLIVFDNVDDPDILYPFLPRNASGHVLITSKDPLAISPFYINKEAVKLTEFDHEETSEFLIRLTGRENDEQDKKGSLKFATRLGGIPLAIVTMAGVITRKNITFAEFLQEYKQGHSRATLFDTRLSPHFAQGYERTIASAYGLDNLENGRDLLDILAFFDPDDIPEDIILNNSTQTAMGTNLSSAARYQDARTELLSSSLITRNRNAKSLTIHRLTQDNALSKMDDDRYEKVFTSVLQLLAGVWPYGNEFGFLGYESYKWPRANELYIHILHLRKLLGRVASPVKFTPEHLQPLKVVLEAAWFGVMRGDFKDTKVLLDFAATMLKPLDSDIEGQREQPKAIIDQFKEQRRLYHFHRGSRALHTNEPKESLAEFEKFWTMLRDEVIEEPGGSELYFGLPWHLTFEAMVRDRSREASRGEDQYLGVAWNELGNAYLQNDDTKKAEACYRKSFFIMDVTDGGVSPNTVSMPLINLGFALWLQGRLAEAAETFERALNYREENYGSDDNVSFATGKLYLGYGNVKKDQNDMDTSFEFHRKCLSQYLTSLGKYHHRVGDGSVRLSDHYVRIGRFADAKNLLDRACDIYGSHTHFRPEQARATYKRASVLHQMQRLEEAERDAQYAFELFRLVAPDDKRRRDELTIRDYDKPIMFWSK